MKISQAQFNVLSRLCVDENLCILKWDTDRDATIDGERVHRTTMISLVANDLVRRVDKRGNLEMYEPTRRGVSAVLRAMVNA